ncbi:early nodulin-like protein 3 [Olea europaea var. sylvestris]|uniref:early nodulin-like protein 3 n=1 Tax=Olea europaea var. sylvestris TaxID=158386 RepID=UPI000C1D4A12|nr:early nodulin-like protein 3 [Olea europaea var. sylvestris]
MAETLLKLSRKVFYVLGLFGVLLLIQKGNAYEFKVGGPKGSWAVPSDPNAASLNKWAETNRFQIGDTLLFVYLADKDSVLHVTKDDYTNCNTAAPLEKFSDGHTVFKFNQSGPYYFISGVADNCQKNEKLLVVVMADRSNHYSNSHQTTAPPPPSTEVPPSPAPTGEGFPSPPPLEEENPALAPSEEPPPPPPNGASAICSTVIGVIGAFVSSSLLYF